MSDDVVFFHNGSLPAAEEKLSLVSFSLEHALSDGIFTPCGTFTAKVTHSNVVQVKSHVREVESHGREVESHVREVESHVRELE